MTQSEQNTIEADHGPSELGRHFARSCGCESMKLLLPRIGERLGRSLPQGHRAHSGLSLAPGKPRGDFRQLYELVRLSAQLVSDHWWCGANRGNHRHAHTFSLYRLNQAT